MKLGVRRNALRLERPLHSAHGTITERVLLSVSILDSDGGCGYGEAAPLEQYDGVGVEQVERALESYAPVLARAEAEGMNGALAKTGALQLVFCLLYSAGILASGGIGS